MHEAAWYHTGDRDIVYCELCPHRCAIAPGNHGKCLVRENKGGILVASNYCAPISTALDPVEKKPLYHYYPASSIFSLGPNGCNLSCRFCQNHEISQTRHTAPNLTPQKICDLVVASKTKAVAYTYAEPIIWFETIRDVGALMHERGVENVMVTNGFIEPGPLSELLDIIDAMNVDIKSMNPQFYRDLCGARLEPVLKTCEAVKKRAHLEITMLLIDGENDSDQEIGEAARFIATNLGPDTPLHLSRAFPKYQMQFDPTPIATMLRGYRIASELLSYVYIGNCSLDCGTDTICPHCQAILIKRSGYTVTLTPWIAVSNGSAICTVCGHPIPGRF